MKKTIVTVLLSLMLIASSCSVPTSAQAPAAQPEAPVTEAAEAAEEPAAEPAEDVSAAEASEEPAEETSGEAAAETAEETADSVLLRVNTDGIGEIAAAEEGTEAAFDDEFPMTSIFLHVGRGANATLRARGREDYQFVKWTQDGAYYSGDADITAQITEDTEFIAVFLPVTGYEGTPVTSAEDAKTMGDVLGLPTYASSTSERFFAFVFDLGGEIWRAVSYIDADTSKALFDLDFEDPDYDSKYNALTAPLPIDRIENLTEMIPSQEELDAFVGMTGEELLAEGFTLSWYDLEAMEFHMNRGLFEYVVTFEGEPGPESEDDYEAIVKPLTVTAIRFDRLGDPTADLWEEE